ncbi:MAG: DNA-binding response regulator [Acidobacteria bacterium]|nr:MAG: DNA-binding response regulator [Acidobacteriota bacterium]
MYRILIIEDQEEVLKCLEINLTAERYQVHTALSGDQGLAQAIKINPDLILLDICLPGMNGVDVCRELRQRGFQMPIIMLTAKTDEIDRVLGLEMGADDYVLKPFGLRELLARIRARLRNRSPNAKERLRRYRFGQVELDFERLRAAQGEKPVDLTPREFDILEHFIRHRGAVVSREQLLDQVWGYDPHSTTRTVDTHILNLRKKLESDPANPQYIVSVYGQGYKFVG